MSFSKDFGYRVLTDARQGEESGVSMHVVVVGSGVAGVSCVEELFRLRSLGYTTGDEEVEPAADCESQPLRVTLIASSRDAARATVVKRITRTVEEIAVETSDEAELQRLFPDLRVVTNTTVERVVPDKRIVRCSDGSAMKYDRLCLCTGARPDIFRSNHPRILAIRDTESVEELKLKVASARRVVVVGNGGVAMELVEAITTADVVWLVKHDFVGNTFLDAEASAFIVPQVSRIRQSVCETAPSPTPTAVSYIETSTHTHGRPRVATSASMGPDWMRHFTTSPRSPTSASGELTIEFKTEVDTIWDLEAKEAPQVWGSEPAKQTPNIRTDFPLLLTTTNGKQFECDLVLCAIGVVPNTDFLVDTLALGSTGGIVVDETMKTVSDNDRIYAAGDCVEVRVSKSAEEEASCWFQMRLWSQARLMGRRAAQSMLGAQDENGLEMELFSHATHFFGLRVVLLGLFNGQHVSHVRDADRIVRVRLEDGAWALFDSRGGVHDDNHRPLVLVRCDPGVEFIKVILVDGVVKGAMLLGETGLEDAMENLVLNQLDVTLFAEHLLDPTVDIEDFFD